MKKCLFIGLLAVGFAGAAIGQTAGKQKLAVYVGGSGDNAVKKVVGSKLTAAITQNSDYIAVERTQEFLSQLRKELFYQRTGYVDDKQIADFGKQMGVDAVCIAEVTGKVFGQTFVSARILNVTTGLVIAAAETYGSFSDMQGTVNASEELAKNLCKTIGFELGDSPKLAVYVGGDGSSEVKKVVGSRLVSHIIGNGYYSAVERTNAFLEQLGKEYDYQNTGNVDDSELTKLGMHFGVKVVCAAEITEGFGELFVSVRLIDVQTSEILYTAEANSKGSSADDLWKLSSNVSESLMKKVVACTKNEKKAQYNECCDGLVGVSYIDISICKRPEKLVAEILGVSDVRIKLTSWNDRFDGGGLKDHGYHLITAAELNEFKKYEIFISDIQKIYSNNSHWRPIITQQSNYTTTIKAVVGGCYLVLDMTNLVSSDNKYKLNTFNPFNNFRDETLKPYDMYILSGYHNISMVSLEKWKDGLIFICIYVK